MEEESTIWYRVMAAAMSIPGINVDRNKFLRAEFSSFCNGSELYNAVCKPVRTIPKVKLDKLAKSCITIHKFRTALTSTALGLPGGWTMAATIPADMAQYFGQSLILAQKLAYLYGFPDLRDSQKQLSKESKDILTLLIGVMMGNKTATNSIKAVSKSLARTTVGHLIGTRSSCYLLSKQVAKWLGIQLTKKTFLQVVGKAIPLLGGVISGVITILVFQPAANRLRLKLSEQMYELC